MENNNKKNICLFALQQVLENEVKNDDNKNNYADKTEHRIFKMNSGGQCSEYRMGVMWSRLLQWDKRLSAAYVSEKQKNKRNRTGHGKLNRGVIIHFHSYYAKYIQANQ